MRRGRAVLGSRTRRAVLSRRRWTKGGRWREAGVGAQGSAQRPWQTPLDASGHCELLLLLLCLASHGACGERCGGSCGERQRRRRRRRRRRRLLCRWLRACGPRQATHIRQAFRCSDAGAGHAAGRYGGAHYGAAHYGAAHVALQRELRQQRLWLERLRLRRWHTLDDARRRHVGRLENRLARLEIA